jgi:hypothetical protein
MRVGERHRFDLAPAGPRAKRPGAREAPDDILGLKFLSFKLVRRDILGLK